MAKSTLSSEDILQEIVESVPEIKKYNGKIIIALDDLCVTERSFIAGESGAMGFDDMMENHNDKSKFYYKGIRYRLDIKEFGIEINNFIDLFLGNIPVYETNIFINKFTSVVDSLNEKFADQKVKFQAVNGLFTKFNQKWEFRIFFEMVHTNKKFSIK